jgi:hypothetical protein
MVDGVCKASTSVGRSVPAQAFGHNNFRRYPNGDPIPPTMCDCGRVLHFLKTSSLQPCTHCFHNNKGVYSDIATDRSAVYMCAWCLSDPSRGVTYALCAGCMSVARGEEELYTLPHHSLAGHFRPK